MSEVIADTAVAVETAPTTETIAPTSAPEVAAAETPAEAPAPNIDDELSAIFRKANPERENGKFVAKEKPAEADKPAVELPPMPASWAKVNEQVWQELTPAARDIVLKREADSAKGVEHLKSQYEPYKGLEAAIKPYEGLLASMGKTPVQGVLSLIEAHQKLSGPDKYRAILDVAQNYGVDLPRMFGPQGQRPGQNAFVDNLVNEVRSLRAEREAEKQAQVQTVQKTLTSEIESFSKKPEYEHFETLKPEMAKLLIAGVADGLEDAYDKAARLNKDVFTQIQSKSQKAAEDKARAEAAKKAASLNVKSSSANSASPKPIDDQLREIYRRSQAS
jgi:hypothetical protein